MPGIGVCRIRATKGNKVNGTLTFVQKGHDVRIQGRVNNLMPNAKHAIHIHEFGDARAPDGTSAGGHYNPAVTLAVWLRGRCDKSDVPGYMIAQLLAIHDSSRLS